MEGLRLPRSMQKGERNQEKDGPEQPEMACQRLPMVLQKWESCCNCILPPPNNLMMSRN